MLSDLVKQKIKEIYTNPDLLELTCKGWVEYFEHYDVSMEDQLEEFQSIVQMRMQKGIYSVVAPLV